MTGFSYRGGVLNAESVPLPRIAEAVGTPVYVYSSAVLAERFERFRRALSGLDATICYALKANDALAVVRTLADLGAGADVVSEGELAIARAAGVPAQKTVFAGVGKSRAEMEAGIGAGILQFNVESLPELEALDQVARAMGRKAPVALRINPDVDARTHAKITTGKSENKFGVPIDEAMEAARRAVGCAGIDLVGLAVHIGSQLTDIEPFRAAFAKMVDLAMAVRAAGMPLKRLDLGGGLGLSYAEEAPPTPEAYGAMVKEVTRPLGLPLLFEPGRHLVGEAGMLLTRVLYVKAGRSRRFVIVDAGMNDLIRPTLYDAHHAMLPVAEPGEEDHLERVDVVGPICESGDVFAEQRPLPPVSSGALLAIGTAGAYGSVMASYYNARPPAAEVMVKGDRFAVIRPRATIEEMIGRDRLPEWLAPPKRSRSSA
ncbi:MAG: diaminopimelate decarboxylase [Rhodospirillales bacterium]|nr:diaminopimelate decarboxylase [Rhodospirillales bacterium]